MLEALVTGESQLRVTRQMLEALYYDPYYPQTIADTLTLNETVHYDLWKWASGSDSLIFSDHAPGDFPVSISDTLVLSDAGQRCQIGSAAEDLDFTDAASFIHAVDDFKPTGDYLTFTETVVVENGKWQYVPQTLTFTETVTWHGSIRLALNHYISFAETVSNNNNPRQSITDLCTFAQYAGRPYSVAIADSLTFVDASVRMNHASDSLTFNQVVVGGKGGDGSDVLAFTQTVVKQASFLKDATTLLNLGQSTSYYYVTPCITKQYHPFIGTSDYTGQPDAPASTTPLKQLIPANPRFQLIYPAAGGIDDYVDLRAPELDNRDSSAHTRINRESRGGNLTVFADPVWPKINTISCTFIGLTGTEIALIQAFILNHIGEAIQVIDWEGRAWLGVVLKPNEPATCDGRDKWSIGFEFEGTRIEDYNPGLSLVFSDTATNIVLRRPIVSDSLIFNESANFRLN